MTLSKAIFLDRKNRDSAIKEAKQAAQDIHDKQVRQKRCNLRVERGMEGQLANMKDDICQN